MTSKDSYHTLLRKWLEETTTLIKTHAERHRDITKLQMILNIVIIIVSTLLGSSIISGINPIFIAPIGLLIAIVAALINLLRLPEVAERHRAAYAKFSIIHRNVEIALADYEREEVVDKEFLRQIERLWSNAHEEAPYVEALSD